MSAEMIVAMATPKFTDTFVMTGSSRAIHPAFLSSQEKRPTPLDSAVVMDTMESAVSLLGPMVRGTPRSSRG